MASTKLAFLAVAVLLLQASWCALSDLHGEPATMAVTSFEEGGDGGGPASCDGSYHSDGDLIVALSKGWYLGGDRCHHKILIGSTQTGRTVTAEVVDLCDCDDDVIATSKAVWDALGLDTNVGEAPISFFDA